MTVTREQVAHLRDGDEVTARFTGYGHTGDPVTSIAREGRPPFIGQLTLAGTQTLRMENGEPGPELLEIVSPLPPEPEPVREPGWYLIHLGDDMKFVLARRWDGEKWLSEAGYRFGDVSYCPVVVRRLADLDGNPVPAPEPCGLDHIKPTHLVFDLDEIETDTLKRVHDAFSAEVEYRDDQIRAAM